MKHIVHAEFNILKKSGGD